MAHWKGWRHPVRFHFFRLREAPKGSMKGYLIPGMKRSLERKGGVMSEKMKQLESTVQWLSARIPEMPQVAMVLGSGLGALAQQIDESVTIPYEEIPAFPHASVQGHAGSLRFGRLAGTCVVAMQGRFHHYEGHEMEAIAFPVRVFRKLGIQSLLLTNAAGGVNLSFVPGDLMVLTDHIGLWADSPLRGPNEETLGPRFPDASHVYHADWIEMAVKTAAEKGFALQQGVYAWCRGPAFETPAEIRALRILGADAVGMSTVPEAMAARHLGMRVLGISCITNMAAGILDQPLTHEEVMETGKMVEERFSSLVAALIPRMASKR